MIDDCENVVGIFFSTSSFTSSPSTLSFFAPLILKQVYLRPTIDNFELPVLLFQYSDSNDSLCIDLWDPKNCSLVGTQTTPLSPCLPTSSKFNPRRHCNLTVDSVDSSRPPLSFSADLPSELKLLCFYRKRQVSPSLLAVSSIMKYFHGVDFLIHPEYPIAYASFITSINTDRNNFSNCPALDETRSKA